MVIIELLTRHEINRFLKLADINDIAGNHSNFKRATNGFAICKYDQRKFWWCRFTKKLPHYMKISCPIFTIDDYSRALKRGFAEHQDLTNDSGGVSKDCHCENLLAGHEVGCYLYK